MPTLLHIESSPRKTRSASLDVARAYLEAYRDAHPDHSIDVLDLWSIALPEFDGDALDAKYADLSGTPLSEAQQQAWAGIRHVAQRLHDADTLLFSVPLWNFSIPYKLKHFIDVVSQRNILFSFDERGSRGLLEDKKALVIYARGLDYSIDSSTPAHSFDFQRPFMEAWLRFVGVTDVESIVVEKTLFGPEVDHAARQTARERAAALARLPFRLADELDLPAPYWMFRRRKRLCSPRSRAQFRWASEECSRGVKLESDRRGATAAPDSSSRREPSFELSPQLVSIDTFGLGPSGHGPSLTVPDMVSQSAFRVGVQYVRSSKVVFCRSLHIRNVHEFSPMPGSLATDSSFFISSRIAISD